MHRRDSFRAEKILQERLVKNPKVEVIWDHVLEEVVGDENPLGVTGAKIKNVKTGEEKLIPVHGAGRRTLPLRTGSHHRNRGGGIGLRTGSA